MVGGHVGAGEDGDDAGRGRRPRRVDLADDRVRVRRANDHAMQLAGNVDVGDKAPIAAQKLAHPRRAGPMRRCRRSP